MSSGTPESALQIRLGELLEQDRFAPPTAFAAGALIGDASVHEEAAKDPAAWWHEQALDLLDWETAPTESLDASGAPFYKWFADGRLNASVQCLDRHVAAGRGSRVAFKWFGEEGEERDITYAQLLDDVQRMANALKARGVLAGDVVGIFLPMIPEVLVAMLACARIGAPHNVVFGGFSAESVRERMEVSEAKVLITVDGARRKGKTAPVKASVDEVMADLPSLSTIFVVRHTGIDVAMDPERDVYTDEAMAAADPECPPEPFDAEHPLFILYSSGSTAAAEGHPAHDGRLPHRGGVDPQERLRPEGRPGRVVLQRRRRVDHRPLVHRLRAVGQRRDERHVRGRAGLPAQGHLVGAVRACGRHGLLHRAHRDPRVHEVGGRVRRAGRPLRATPARNRR